jgi:hypothetical protein
MRRFFLCLILTVATCGAAAPEAREIERMSNLELAQAPEGEAVFIAQLERKGIDADTIENALAHLATLHESTREIEIAAALLRMDERGKDTGAAGDLGRLLAAAPSCDLLKARDLILRMASKKDALPGVRRAGLAARVVMEGSPANAWAATEANPESRALLLEAIALISDPGMEARFRALMGK